MLKRQKLRYSIYKIFAIIALVFLLGHFNPALAGHILINDSADLETFSDPSVSAVIPGIFPVMDFYAYWDTLTLNPYRFEIHNFSGIIQLPLLESDCGFSLPVASFITSGFGSRWGRAHTGLDLNLKTGDPVSASFDGVVRMSCWYYGYGNVVVIRHHNGLETLYGHLSKRVVKPGDLINAGQVVGYGGSTGHSTGPHLHFETRFLGRPFNPDDIIDFQNDSLRKDSVSFDSKFLATPKVVAYAPKKYYKARYTGYKKGVARKSTYKKK